MSVTNLIILLFNRPGVQWIAYFLLTLGSFYKTKRIHKFKYVRESKKWLQTYKGTCYFIDEKPNWNKSIESLEDYVTSTHFIIYQPKDGDIIIDLGAGTGTEAIIYSKKVKSGNVFAIEAHPQTFNSLKLLKEINGYENISVFNMAISEKEGVLFIENRTNHDENSIKTNLEGGIAVNAISLDMFVKNNNIKKIDFIKMNIEGAESTVIKGMKESVKIIKYFAISCHDFLYDSNSTKIRDEITNFFETNNFEVIHQPSTNKVRNSWVYGKNKML